MREADIAWCPGCGNFGILNALKKALAELDIPPEKLVIVSGIGQAAKTPQYLRTNMFNGLHGRSLPAATAIKASNPSLTVIAESGDGCMYGEGGNHLVHAIRRNPDITVLVHNNMVYGLTKGQASPTSPKGFATPVQVKGVFEEPFNPAALAISLGASFVARTFSGDVALTVEIIKKAVLHRGFSLVDIFQPCVTFNKLNTFAWFREHTRRIDASHDPFDPVSAFRKALETDPFPLGILFLRKPAATFEDNVAAYRKDSRPLFERETDAGLIRRLTETRRL